MRKDDVTADLPGVPKRRGRPPTGKAMTPAQKKAVQRKRMADEGIGVLTVPIGLDVIEALRKHVQFKDEDQAGAVDRILRSYLLRKR
jgi:hypothetical protein